VPSNMDDREARGHESPPHETPLHETRGYETRDANTRAVLGFLAVLFVVLNLVLFGSWRLFRYYTVADRPPEPASSFADERQIPPAPDLAVNGREDLLNSYAKQQQDLEIYAWEDRKAGVVRIPIERAMDLLLKKGLPVAPSGSEKESAPENSAQGAQVQGISRGGER
jgi:hypothetical protein